MSTSSDMTVPARLDDTDRKAERPGMAYTHQLGQLIDGIKAVNGWSDTDLARNAKERGHVISKSNISRYRTNPVVSIKADAIRTIADALRVKPSQVAVAAIESMGIAMPSYDAITPEQAIDLDVHMSARDKSVALSTLRGIRASSSSGASDAPGGQEGDRSSDDSESGSAAGVDAGTAPGIAELEVNGTDDDCEESS